MAQLNSQGDYSWEVGNCSPCCYSYGISWWSEKESIEENHSLNNLGSGGTNIISVQTHQEEHGHIWLYWELRSGMYRWAKIPSKTWLILKGSELNNQSTCLICVDVTHILLIRRLSYRIAKKLFKDFRANNWYIWDLENMLPFHYPPPNSQIY